MTRDDPWRQSALCAAEPDLFYPPGATWENHDAQAAVALAVCKRCPVIAECLKWALDRDDRFAIAGGTTPRMRRRMLGLSDMETDACGTFPKGYGRHRRKGEKPCEECRIAANDYQAARRAAAKASTTQTAAVGR